MGSGAPKRKLEVQPVVFGASTLIILAVVLSSILAADQVGAFFEDVQQKITAKLGWLYVLSMTGFLVFAIWLMCSRFGRIRLGPDNSRPEFSRPTWFAMLFSAGMGIGLLFFSVAEPILHYSSPPVGDGETLQATRNAMGLTFFHWGLHPWAVYAIVGLALAYFGFRRELPFSIRSTFHPLLGDRIHGRFGDAIDTLAIVSTLFRSRHVTRLGSDASQCRTHSRLWPHRVDNSSDRNYCHDHCHCHRLGRLWTQNGNPTTQRTQYGVGWASPTISPNRGPDSVPTQRLCRKHRRLPRATPQSFLLDSPSRGTNSPKVAWALDRLLLGLVDCMGSLCRHVHRTHLQRANYPGVFGCRPARAHTHRIHLAHCVWQHSTPRTDLQRRRHFAGSHAEFANRYIRLARAFFPSPKLPA